VAWVSVSNEDCIKLYDPANLGAAPQIVPIAARMPRALVAKPNGSSVFVAVFNINHQTTALSEAEAGDSLPPPNPPMKAGLPPAPKVGLIVRKNSLTNNWLDESGHLWNSKIPYDLQLVEFLEINTTTHAVVHNYNDIAVILMGAAYDPVHDLAAVCGTYALNDVRFEPKLNGHNTEARLALCKNDGTRFRPLVNPQINYSVPTGTAGGARFGDRHPDGRRVLARRQPRLSHLARLEQARRVQRLDRRAARARADRRRADGRAARSGARAHLRRGPVPQRAADAVDRIARQSRHHRNRLRPDARRHRERPQVLLRRHDVGPRRGSVRVVPHLRRHGQPGLGSRQPAGRHAGEAAGPADPLLQGYHPMKGPMMTQSLRGLPGTGLLHWRGDRANLAAFNPAFVSLLGRAAVLPDSEMTAMSNFINPLVYPPNPNENLDRSMPDAPLGQPSALRGQSFFMNTVVDGPLRCVSCHAMPTGTNGQVIDAAALQASQDMKVPHLRNLYKKSGFKDTTGVVNKKGFGFTHNGSVDNLFDFLKFPGFNFGGDPVAANATRRDLEAFLLAFDTGLAPAVGAAADVRRREQRRRGRCSRGSTRCGLRRRR
jgi:hypothetical protein